MAAVVYDFTLEQGATLDNTCYPPLVITDATGALVDISTWTPRAMIRKKYSDTNPTATFTCTKDLPTSTIQLSLTAEQTAAIPTAVYVYDIEIEDDDSGVVRRIVQGVITVSAEATK